MSLNGALNAVVSALGAQSTALSIIGNNLANSNTTAYKAGSASFKSMLAGAGGSRIPSGGVTVGASSNVASQGLLNNSAVATNIAIDGAGFFVVRAGTQNEAIQYTRNGEFALDPNGYLVNNGQYLQGWPTDANGEVIGTASMGSLQAISTTAVSGNASPTSNMAFAANLPAQATVGDTFTSSFEIFDSQGTAASVEVTWTKTATNEWTASFANPTMASDPSTPIGTIGTAPVTLTFNPDGTLASPASGGVTLAVTGWATGAANSAISLDFGTPGSASGMTQFSTDTESPLVELETTKDGVPYGRIKDVKVGDGGTVFAVYDNGQERAIYKLPVATFVNPDGLAPMSGGVYTETADSGSVTLRMSGSSGAGTIFGSTLEASTTDTNQEFSRMMTAQQAYSAAAQVMSTVNSMYDTLISAVR